MPAGAAASSSTSMARLCLTVATERVVVTVTLLTMVLVVFSVRRKLLTSVTGTLSLGALWVRKGLGAGH